MYRVGRVMVAFVLVLTGATSRAQVSSDVSAGHWAYEAVQQLAAKGLIKGYPPDGNFLGARTLKRYEMACIVQRVLERVDELCAARSDGAQPAKAPVPLEQQDVTAVKRLVEEFKVELTVIGAEVSKVKADLDRLRSETTAIGERLSRQEAATDEISAQVADLRKAADAAGAEGKKQADRLAKAETGKVDTGFGRLKVSGLIQVWGIVEADAPHNGVVDTLRLRRAELKLSGSINPRAYFTMMIDPAKNLSLNTTSSGGNVTSVSVNQASNVLQDLVLGYHLTPGLALEAGQQKSPLSMDSGRSSAQLPTVERALFNTLPVNNGRVSDSRSGGLMLRYRQPVVEAQLGIFSDGGSRQNATDDNNDKEIVWHTQYKGLRNLVLGAYQAISGGVGTARTLRHRLGLEAALQSGPHRLEGEWAQGRDGDPAVRSHGGYLVYIHRISPIWEVVGRGDYWNPDRGLHGAAWTREYDLTLGANYYLADYHAKIQLNWVRKNIVGPLNASGTGPSALPALGLDRNLFLLSLQQAF